MTSTETPVLVVGAGAVGLALASELRRHGVRCRVVDKKDGTTKWSKALVVHARTMELFERAGIIGEALARGRPTRGALMRAFGQEILHIDLGDLDAPYNFFLDLNQSDTEAIFEEHLHRLGGSVEWNTEVVRFEPGEGGVSVRLRRADGTEEETTYAYVCACDGAHSFVRKAMDLPFPGAPYDAQFFLADVRLDWDRSPDQWYADIMPEGLFFAAPLKEEGRWRVITELPLGQGERPGTLVRGESPDEADLRAIMRRMAPDGTRAHDPIWLSWFKVSHRILDDFRHGRVFFVGDAAHIHAPVGGQGMNIGIHDAFNLAWKLALVVQAVATDGLLDSYGAERRPAAAGVVDITDTIISAALSKGPLGRTLSMTGARIVDRLPAAKGYLERVLSEIAVNYRGSPIVGEHRAGLLQDGSEGWLGGARRWRAFSGAPQPGDRAPDARLRRADGSIVRLHECLTGTGFHILYFPKRTPAGVEPSLRGSDLLRRAREGLGGRVSLIEVSPSLDGVEPASVRLRDDRGNTREAYGADDSCLYLIRPDGHVGFRSQPADLGALLDHIDGMLHGRSDVAVGPTRLPPRGDGALAAARGAVSGPATGRALGLAAVFAAAGASKLAGSRAMRATFDRYGFRHDVMRAVGALEVAGAAAIASGRTRPVGAAALATVCVGAAGTHLLAGERAGLLRALGLLGVAGSVLLAARRQR